ARAVRTRRLRESAGGRFAASPYCRFGRRPPPGWVRAVRGACRGLRPPPPTAMWVRPQNLRPTAGGGGAGVKGWSPLFLGRAREGGLRRLVGTAPLTERPQVSDGARGVGAFGIGWPVQASWRLVLTPAEAGPGYCISGEGGMRVCPRIPSTRNATSSTKHQFQ